MVGHVNRNKQPLVKSADEQVPAGTHSVGVAKGEVHGVAEIRDKDGNLKGTFTFGGPTDLTREQLEQELGLQIPVTPAGESNGGDTD
jgi:hypothetical protein